jgi:hypothetical protein
LLPCTARYLLRAVPATLASPVAESVRESGSGPLAAPESAGEWWTSARARLMRIEEDASRRTNQGGECRWRFPAYGSNSNARLASPGPPASCARKPRRNNDLCVSGDQQISRGGGALLRTCHTVATSVSTIGTNLDHARNETPRRCSTGRSDNRTRLRWRATSDSGRTPCLRRPCGACLPSSLPRCPRPWMRR